MPYFKVISLTDILTKSTRKLNVSDVSDFNEEGIFVGKNSKYSFYDYTGKKLFDRSFENIEFFRRYLRIAGKWLQQAIFSR